MKKLIPIFTLCAFLCACSSDIREDNTRITKIESIPTGMNIIVNGMNVGKTPLSLESETNEEGCFVRQITITALASSAELHTQVKSFPAFTPTNMDKSLAPEKIIFNMYKNPSESGGVEVE